MRFSSKLCENTKYYKYAYTALGQIKWYMGPVNKNPKKKFKI